MWFKIPCWDPRARLEIYSWLVWVLGLYEAESMMYWKYVITGKMPLFHFFLPFQVPDAHPCSSHQVFTPISLYYCRCYMHFPVWSIWACGSSAIPSFLSVTLYRDLSGPCSFPFLVLARDFSAENHCPLWHSSSLFMECTDCPSPRMAM